MGKGMWMIFYFGMQMKLSNMHLPHFIVIHDDKAIKKSPTSLKIKNVKAKV